MKDFSLLDLDAYFASAYFDGEIFPDDILKLQERKKIRAGNGRLGGYHRVQREKIAQSLEKLQKADLPRVTQKINPKIFNYHPVKQAWEKCIAYSCIAHGRKSFQAQISKILPETNLYPKKTREKFEKTLNCLCKDGIIQSWSYKNIDEELLAANKNWLHYWKALSVKIKLPW